VNRELRPVRIIAFLVGAIVLASAVMAMARTPHTSRHHAQMKSRIEQNHRVRQHVPAGQRLARIAAHGNISRYTSSAGHRCRAQFTYCKPGAQRTAAEVVVCRPAKRANDKPTCAVVSDGVKQVFCQFAFACDGRSSHPSRKPVMARAAAGNKVALLNRPHNQNSLLMPPDAPPKPVAGNDDPVGENSKIEAANMALLRAAQ